MGTRMNSYRPQNRRTSKVPACLSLYARLAAIAAVLGALVLAAPAGGQTPSGGAAAVGEQPASAEVEAAPAPGPAASDPVKHDVFGETDTVELTAADCEGTNRSMWVGIAAMDAIALLLFFVAFGIVTSRTWLRLGALRNFLTVLAPFATLAAVLVGTIRPAQEVFTKCVENADLRQLLQLVEFAGWQRGLVFGLVPVTVLAFLLKAIHGRFFAR